MLALLALVLSSAVGVASAQQHVREVNAELSAQTGLRTFPCDDLSIFSLRVTLKALLKAKRSKVSASYPMYATEEEMRAQWVKLPGVSPGDNPESRLVKHAHCHEAVMWFTQQLMPAEQEFFKHDANHMLPLLPTSPAGGQNSVLTNFYKSKVLCGPACVPTTMVAAQRNAKRVQLNRAVRSQAPRAVPCDELSIFSLRVVLKALLAAGGRNNTSVEPPMYASEPAMVKRWSELPAVPYGDSLESRLVKHAHCHEAATWFLAHLTPQQRQTFAQTSFVPLLPETELHFAPPSESSDRLNAFYASKAACGRCLDVPAAATPLPEAVFV